MAEQTEDTGSRAARSPGEVRAKVVGVLAGVVRWVTLIFALILVLHVVLVMGNANEANTIASTIRDWAGGLVLAFENLFTPEDVKLGVLVNYGLAAIFWLVVGSVVTRLLRRLA